MKNLKTFIIDLGTGLPIEYQAESQRDVINFLKVIGIKWITIQEITK
jgi:hypothetical protein